MTTTVINGITTTGIAVNFYGMRVMSGIVSLLVFFMIMFAYWTMRKEINKALYDIIKTKPRVNIDGRCIRHRLAKNWPLIFALVLASVGVAIWAR